MTGEEVADTIKVDIMSQVKPAHHHGNVLSSQCKTDSLIINIIDALNCTRIKQFLSTEVSTWVYILKQEILPYFA